MLTVQGVTEAQDEGEFTCHASNLAGNNSATLTLSVQGALTMHDSLDNNVKSAESLICFLLSLVLPSAVATPTSQELSADEIASFDCVTSGDPAPQVRWLNAMSVDVTSLSDPRIEVIDYSRTSALYINELLIMLVSLPLSVTFSLHSFSLPLSFSYTPFLSSYRTAMLWIDGSI